MHENSRMKLIGYCLSTKVKWISLFLIVPAECTAKKSLNSTNGEKKLDFKISFSFS